ncbi:MAG TPA: NAD-dependent epimerase/dehydratase family protein [Gemmatimonadaceae bacterium]
MVDYDLHAPSAGASPAAAIEELPQSDASHSNRTVLVTGASGFVGLHACRELSRSGWRVRALVRNRARAVRRLSGVRAQFVIGDMRDAAVLANATRDADAIVHLAAIAIERPGQSYESVNADATIALLRAARAAGVKRLLHMSQNGASSASPYRFLRSKGVAEDRVRASGLRWTVFRPSVIFGPEDEFVNVLARLVLLTPVIFPLPGGGEARFQPVAVEDIARAIGVALDRPDTEGQAYAMGGPEVLTLRQIVERVLLAMGARRILVGVPVPLLHPVVALAQRILPNPPVTSSLLDLLKLDNTVGDVSTWPDLGLSPTAFTPEALAYLASMRVSDALRAMAGKAGG